MSRVDQYKILLINSDNGTQFTLKQFVHQNRIKHVLSAPHYTGPNGQAEIIVQIVKNALEQKRHMKLKLVNYLYQYKELYHSSTTKSPAMLMLKKKISEQG